MRSSIALRNIVCIGCQTFVVAVLPLHSDFNFDGGTVGQYSFLGVEDLRVENRARLIFIFDIGDQALVSLELSLMRSSQIFECYKHTRI